MTCSPSSTRGAVFYFANTFTRDFPSEHADTIIVSLPVTLTLVVRCMSLSPMKGEYTYFVIDQRAHGIVILSSRRERRMTVLRG